MALAMHQIAQEKKKAKEQEKPPEPKPLPEATTEVDLQLAAAPRFGEAHTTVDISSTIECSLSCKESKPEPPKPASPPVVEPPVEDKPIESTVVAESETMPVQSTVPRENEESTTSSVTFIEPLAVSTEEKPLEVDADASSSAQSIPKDNRDLLSVAISPRQGGGPSSSDDRSSRHDDDDESSTFDDEDVHVEITTKLRHRVQNEMDAQGLFDSYAYVGLQELELDGDDPERNAVLIEERMQEMKEIYHKYRRKMARLDRLYKTTMRNKRRREKEQRAKESAGERLSDQALSEERAVEPLGTTKSTLSEIEASPQQLRQQ
ncbi:hypothetical protein AAVH_01194 [Aphelenchoides avenae]|nr:hypothetical protein AAVH_01194 [Aphelenchus avenae]